MTLDDYLPLQYPGPVSRQRIFRLKLVWLQLAIVGFGIAMFSESTRLQGFGLGMIFPGAGFLQHAAGSWSWILMHIGLVLLSVLLFLMALFLWFWNGNLLAPVAVWVLTAASAGWMDHPESPGIICSVRILGYTIPAAPFIALLLVALATFAMQRLARKGLRKRTQALVARRRVAETVTLPASPTNAEGTGREVVELSYGDVAAMRFALDRALQPVDKWQGFHFGDQWQPAATRYQVNTLGWALALVNHNALPAMRGYLQQAQLNLIEKSKDHKLWRYWRWENLWGNLRWNPDPMPIDNIMYSGYMAMQIGMYQAVTGDLRHDRHGALTLVDADGESHVYDFPRVAEIVGRQFESDYCLWPCEPNMIYPSCNNYAGIGLAAYDAAHGTDYWARIEHQFRKKLREEFTLPDGTVITLKSAYTGLPLLGGGVPALLTVAAFMSPLMPDLAALQWALARAELFEGSGKDLRLLDERKLLFPDPGNYRRSQAFSLSCILMSAAEMGDSEAFALASELRDRLLNPTITHGVLAHPESSVWVNAQLLMGRVGGTLGMHDLARHGASKKWLTGPLVSHAPYPDVLVAKAVSDGDALEVVAYPGGSSAQCTIGLTQLKPGVRYRMRVNQTGAGTLLADAEGQATLSLELAGRTHLFLHPELA